MNLGALLHNYVLNCAALSWFLAQFIKTILVLLTTGKLKLERMFGSGGMPSAHSACVCALAIATCRKVGFSSVEFAITFVLACVVMYDALNVRRQAGEHAKAINIVVDHINDNDTDDAEISGINRIKELKESLGHKPMEVLAGSLLGIIISMILPL